MFHDTWNNFSGCLVYCGDIQVIVGLRIWAMVYPILYLTMVIVLLLLLGVANSKMQDFMAFSLSSTIQIVF